MADAASESPGETSAVDIEYLALQRQSCPLKDRGEKAHVPRRAVGDEDATLQGLDDRRERLTSAAESRLGGLPHDCLPLFHRHARYRGDLISVRLGTDGLEAQDRKRRLAPGKGRGRRRRLQVSLHDFEVTF
jgi:hypothetical protein